MEDDEEEEEGEEEGALGYFQDDVSGADFSGQVNIFANECK